MLKDNLININVSIFYNKQNWHLLLENCLNHLINNSQNSFLIREFLIYFNYEKGENIRISWLCEPEDSNRMVNEFDQFVTDFIFRSPSSSTQIKYPLQNLFMNFPNNSIKYNLYQFEEDNQNNDMRKLVSRHILEVLGKDIIDTESIFSFCFYIHVKFIKCYFDLCNNNTILNTLENLLVRETDMFSAYPGISNEIKKSFEMNKDILLEIHRDVIEKSNPEIESWLVDWDILFKSYMTEASTDKQFFSFSRVIQKHLGLETKQILLCWSALLQCYRPSEIDTPVHPEIF